MAHAVVTGASGLLGANLAVELIAQGHTVTATRRPSTDTSSLADLPIKWVCADLGSVAELCNVFAGADVVFHCAACVSTKRTITPAILAVNVDATRAVVEAAIAVSTPRVVHTSTANTIGPTPDGTPADEQTPSESESRRHALAASRSNGIPPLGEGACDDSRLHAPHNCFHHDEGHGRAKLEDFQHVPLVGPDEGAERH